jgi:DNA-directed RNA polymerase
MEAQISEYLNKKYSYESKAVRVAQMNKLTPLAISAKLWTALCRTQQDRTPIQNVATRLGTSLGYTDPLDAVKTGAEILAICQAQGWYTLELTRYGTYVIPNLPKEALIKTNFPVFKPNKWRTNHNGEDSIILGGGMKHHDQQQSYDVLNILQDIEWCIDTEVLRYEKNPKAKHHSQRTRADFNAVYNDLIGRGFYFKWRYDMRGRSYMHSYFVNYQSHEYDKALLSPRKKVVTKNLSNIKIAVANEAGQDKLLFEERIAWFDEQLAKGFNTEEFKYPILGRKALRAYALAEKGLPSNYMMGLDATASGLQIMSALIGCKTTAQACNLVYSGTREDLYTLVSDTMNKTLTPEDYVTRGVVKQPVMTHYYNSLEEPKKAFNEAQLEAFYDALDGLCPGAVDVMDTINAFWDKHTFEHSWTLPDGHRSVVPVVETVDTRVEVDELNHRRFAYIYKKNKPSRKSTSLVPNIVHSIDGYVAREMVRRCPFDIVHIFDCFYFYPDHMDEASRIYREILADIAQSNLLADILSEISGKNISIAKDNDDLHIDILASKYAIS